MLTQQIPAQIKSIADEMLDNKVDVHIRNNYKQRLLGIKNYIDEKIRDYDSEVNSFFIKNQRKKR